PRRACLGGGSRTVPESSRLLSLQELAAAACAAEIVFRALDLGGMAGGRDRHAHAADRVFRFTGSFSLCNCGLAPVLDDLRHDAERDFLGRTRSQVEPGRRENSI